MNKYEVKYTASCIVEIIIEAKNKEEAFKMASEGTFNERYIEILETPSDCDSDDVISIEKINN